VVEDRLFLSGKLEERTSDYYAQDRCGNVWYFGEDTAELDSHGRVIDTWGSFHAGIDGAQPGVLMQARPQAVAEPHGGRVEAVKAPGEGAAVSLVVPAASP
jgi:hypothetical protein